MSGWKGSSGAKYKPTPCIDCLVLFTRRAPSQNRCKECAVKYKAAYKKEWNSGSKYAATRRAYQEQPEAKFAKLKHSANTRGIGFSLTYEEFLNVMHQPCSFCGGSTWSATGSGIDRKDSDIDYETGNIQPCCRTCNVAKHTMTDQEFIDWISRVSKHLKVVAA